MVKEIYTRVPEDPYYENSVIDYTNEVESLISQIRMLIGTKKGEVLGESDFGIDLSYLVFGTLKNAVEIRKVVKEQFEKYLYVSPNLVLDYNINFGKSTAGRDFAVLDIYINGAKSVGFLVDEN